MVKSIAVGRHELASSCPFNTVQGFSCSLLCVDRPDYCDGHFSPPLASSRDVLPILAPPSAARRTEATMGPPTTLLFASSVSQADTA